MSGIQETMIFLELIFAWCLFLDIRHAHGGTEASSSETDRNPRNGLDPFEQVHEGRLFFSLYILDSKCFLVHSTKFIGKFCKLIETKFGFGIF